jgi:hypothetical protein
MELIVGDWSNDGHGHSTSIIVQTNYDPEDITKAYAQSVEKTGIAFDEDSEAKIYLFTMHEGNKIPKEAREILSQYFDMRKYGEEIWTSDDYFDLWFNFVKISLPDLIMDKCRTEWTLIIGGYGIF